MFEVKVTETVFQNMHPSLIAKRIEGGEMISLLKKLDSIGYYALGVWNEHAFDASHGALYENPWERLKMMRKFVTHTKLLLSLTKQATEGQKRETFIRKAVYHGVDIIRILYTSTEMGEIETCVRTIQKEGGQGQIAIAYTAAAPYDIGHYLGIARRMKEIGAESICLVDQHGGLTPYSAFEMITMLKHVIKIPVHFHSCHNSDMVSMAYLKAIEAGADVIDASISMETPGCSGLSTETIVKALSGTKYDTGLDVATLKEISACMERWR
ncbi:pyruvate/oxaloacetate carboxyltransferase [Anaerosolibacter carboniphilus]|uniref:Pyruvate/oxaloacetate carboxyltransferase n=1 Tax=Anaerosolibacter carboniphilus TaxID=1417629 RepID=A0A841KW56_9FIRM|nr:hypothetical protein [Anaerosolibacter carboniphilus]MBB6214419.1 pyruvate/oxaloacetate carboxyltransferase [Anaerosolibacter carboniphilus]